MLHSKDLNLTTYILKIDGDVIKQTSTYLCTKCTVSVRMCIFKQNGAFCTLSFLEPNRSSNRCLPDKLGAYSTDAHLRKIFARIFTVREMSETVPMY